MSLRTHLNNVSIINLSSKDINWCQGHQYVSQNDWKNPNICRWEIMKDFSTSANTEEARTHVQNLENTESAQQQQKPHHRQLQGDDNVHGNNQQHITQL
jgi:hypothetical protein